MLVLRHDSTCNRTDTSAQDTVTTIDDAYAYISDLAMASTKWNRTSRMSTQNEYLEAVDLSPTDDQPMESPVATPNNIDNYEQTELNRRSKLPDDYSLAGPSADTTSQHLDTVGTLGVRKLVGYSGGSATGYVNEPEIDNKGMCDEKLVDYAIVKKKIRATSGDKITEEHNENVNDETAMSDKKRESDAPKFVDNDLYATCI